MQSTAGTYYRLIALWVICEAMLGGIIHGLKLPISGLIVGSCAVICISLIAWYVPARGAILKATVIVAIFKMMLSPQAPPPAYFAVFFQGLLGELLFFNKRHFRLSCILFAVLALVESGLQRIFVLTILYGNDFWKVVNDFANNITRQQRPFNYSFWFAGIYAAIHALTGIVVGWWASVLPKKAEKWNFELIVSPGDFEIKPNQKKKRMRKALLVTWIILILLYIQSYWGLGNPILPSHIVLKIFLRSTIIVLAWVFLLKPVIQFLLDKWLVKMKSKWQAEIKTVLELLPETKAMMVACWKRSAGLSGLARIGLFSRLILANLGSNIYILTGKIGSGKTSSLIRWSENREDVFGILTPVVNGKRMFMDIHTREQFDMEAGEYEERILEIGRYKFSEAAFEKAGDIIQSAIDKKGWLVIDEIGPLELNDTGFARVLKQVLKDRNQKTLLVVRDKHETLQEVVKKFDYRMMTTVPFSSFSGSSFTW